MSQSAGKMVTGFNHNIKHKGRVFHVQTEDSGVDSPHIITHLFMGGNILASKKTSYADIVHAENLPALVKALMEEQQKEMLRNLIRGVYDDVVEQYTARAWQPGAVDAGDGGAPGQGDVAGPAALPKREAPPPSGTEPAAPMRPEVAAARSMKVPPKPREGGETIFGEDLISERSLDEVILSYLAEDGNET